jgi:hypothetical protein
MILLMKPLTKNSWLNQKPNQANLRVLSISVDKEDNENIEMVPLKASAGYLNGYADPEYVAQLPKFYLPMFKQGTYRGFRNKRRFDAPTGIGYYYNSRICRELG